MDHLHRTRPAIRLSRPQQLTLASAIILLLAIAAFGIAQILHPKSAGVRPTASSSAAVSSSVAPTTTPVPSSTARSSAIGIQVADITFVDNSHGWALGSSSCTSQGSCNLAVRATVDGGLSWKSVATPRIATEEQLAWHIRFDSLQDGWIFGPRLYMTHDGGGTWSDTGTQNQTLSLVANGSSVWAIESPPDCLPGVCQLALYQSSDGGRSWSRAAVQPSMIGLNAQLLRDGSNAWVVSWGATANGTNSSLSATNDNGATWHNLIRPCAPQTSAEDAAAEAEGQLWIVCGGQPGAGNQFKQLIVSVDGGIHWNYPSNPPSAGYLQELALQFVGVSNFNLWMAAERAQLEELAAFSSTWSSASTHGLNASSGGSGVIRVIFGDIKHGWAATTDTVYRTTDGGAHWSSG